MVDIDKEQFKINRETVSDLFKTKIFNIPDFQRDYDWDSEYLTFLEDLVTSYNQGGQEYYIGTVITYRDKQGVLQVIDGQQRLTSLFILTAAYWIHLGSKKQSLKKQNAVKNLLVKDDELWDSDSDDDVFLLQTTDPNGQSWIEELMRSGKKPIDCLNDGNKKHSTALSQAIKFFRDTENPSELFTFIMNNIVISHVEALNFRQAYIVFERMNDRGRELTIPDKIKYIFMGRKTNDIDEFRIYSKSINEKWRLVADQFQNNNEFTDFLMHYFVAFLVENYKWIDKSGAVSWFRRYWDATKDPTNLLDDMYKKAMLYNGFKHAMDNSSVPIENQHLKYKRTYFASNITQHLPMLLAASELTQKQFDTIASYVLKLCFVMQVTRQNWNVIRDGKNNSITSFVMDIRKKDMENLEKNVVGLFRKIISKENFSGAITSQGFFDDNSPRKLLRKFLVLKVEEIVMNDSGGLFTFQDEDTSEDEDKQEGAKRNPRPKTTSERITNEHIIASNTAADAIVKSTPDGMHTEDIKKLIGRMGNFVALGEVLNKTLQDRPAREKVDSYIEQNRTDTARLVFADYISTKDGKNNAEIRTMKKYHFTPIKLSYVKELDGEGQPVFSEDWDAIYNKDKEGFYIKNKKAVGYFLEKQIAQREHTILLVLQNWLGLKSKGKVEGKTVIDSDLFRHPQSGLFKCPHC